jgi:hypothetical protein
MKVLASSPFFIDSIFVAVIQQFTSAVYGVLLDGKKP